jgi:uncharacterized membrane protein
VKRALLTCALLGAIAAGVARADPPGSGFVSGRVLVNPLYITVLVPSTPVRTGRDFRIRAEVDNAGSTALQDVAVTLVRPTGLVLRDPARQVLPRVGPGRDRRVRWDVCARNAGSYVVMARAASGAFTSESSAEIIQVNGNRNSC